MSFRSEDNSDLAGMCIEATGRKIKKEEAGFVCSVYGLEESAQNSV